MKNLKEVDWSIAPEGATHFNAECSCPWLRRDPASFYYDGQWVEYKSVDAYAYWEDHFNNAVKRPQEWDGNGVPPVGTVCEYRLNDGKWFKCKITYTLSGNDDCFVTWCDHLAIEQVLRFTAVPYKLYLRKIKTPEQIAEEERLDAIAEMGRLAQRSGSTYNDAMSALYDAGYRKT